MKRYLFLLIISGLVICCEEKVDPPTITNFSPKSGLSGSVISVEGENFSSEMVVLLDGKKAATTVQSNKKLSFIVPNNLKEGNYPIYLSNGASSGNSIEKFTILPSPNILYTLPTSGGTGARVLIYGTYFDPLKENNIVRFNGVKVPVEEIHSGYIIVYVPDEARTGKISLEINNIVVQSPTDFVISPWEELANLTGQGASGSIACVINNEIYVGGGHVKYNSGGQLTWKYNPARNEWLSANIYYFAGGEEPRVAVQNNMPYHLNAWQSGDNFNTVSIPGTYMDNIQLPPYPGYGRYAIIMFSADNKIYAGLGYDPIKKINLNDIWSFDLTKKEWSQELIFPGSGTFDAKVFVIGEKIFIGAGALVSFGANTIEDKYIPTKEFWSYNLRTSEWKAVADFPYNIQVDKGLLNNQMLMAYHPTSLSIGNLGYVNVGNSLTEYNSITNEWRSRTKVPSNKIRFANVFVTLNGKIYLGMGGSALQSPTGWNAIKDYISLDDFWRYDPSKDN